MSWIAEYDTQGREFPTCVHVTKTTGTMTHGVTYVPIEDGKAVRAENAKLRELVGALEDCRHTYCGDCVRWDHLQNECSLYVVMRELGVEVDALQAENAKLRNEVDNLLDFEHLTSVAVAYAGCDECGEYKQAMFCLFAENAKMRKLLADAWGYINHPADATWTHKKRKEVRYSIGDRMRDLGVEVDG
jgi:hypothetical protein